MPIPFELPELSVVVPVASFVLASKLKLQCQSVSLFFGGSQFGCEFVDLLEQLLEAVLVLVVLVVLLDVNLNLLGCRLARQGLIYVRARNPFFSKRNLNSLERLDLLEPGR